MPWEPLFGSEGRLVYRMSFNGAPCGTHWTAPAGEVAPGLFAFDLFLEIDPSVLGHGGSVQHGRARLLCNADLEPVHYASEMMGARVEVRFEPDRIKLQLPDRSTLELDRGGARYLMEANHVGLDALMLAHARAAGQLGDTAELRMFLVNSAATIPYRLEAIHREAPPDGRWYRTSLDEELRIGAAGLEESLNTTAGVRIERALPPPPLPAWQAPPPVEPARYHRPEGARARLEDVTIPGPVVELGAAVTIPEGTPPFPAVVFIGGSGVHDRHGMVGELDTGTHEIVDHLGEHAGVLGVRYDTRGAGTTAIGPDALTAGLDAIIADARAVVEWTLARPDVDPDRLILIGHSQGGTVAMALAARHHVRAAGIVLLATLGRSMEAVSRDQIHEGARLHGFDPEQLELQLERNRELFALIRSDVPWTEEHVPPIHLAAAGSVPWIREYLRHDPQELAAQLRCPILILHGSADFQVSPEADARALAEAARAAGVEVTAETLPELDHLFKPAQVGSSTLVSYYDRARHVDPGFLARLSDWIAERVR